MTQAANRTRKKSSARMSAELLRSDLLTEIGVIHFFSVRVDQSSNPLLLFLRQDECWCKVLGLLKVHLSNAQLQQTETNNVESKKKKKQFYTTSYNNKF